MKRSQPEAEKELSTLEQYRIWKQDFDARHAAHQGGGYLEKPMAKAASRTVRLGILFNTVLAASLFG